MCKIGIPRGMFFYDYYPLWKEFFEELGVETIVSQKTNKKILDSGIFSCVDDACLPVKIFHGHVESLKNEVDYIFIPRIMSIYSMEYCCPKVLGLPDMVRHSIKDLPPIIDTQINLRKSSIKYKNSIYKTGRNLGKEFWKIKKAYGRAEKFHDRYIYLLNKGVTPIEAIKTYDKVFKNVNYSSSNCEMTVMIIGHPYTIYDDYLNMNIISKLIDKNIKVITPEMINEDKVNYYSNKLPKRMFWTHGKRIVGSTFSLIEEKKIDGLIYLSSFGCGLDSVLVDLVERKAISEKIPFTLLTLDEQTGEAGINTRIEAFIDMMKWRSKDEDNISASR